MTDTSQDPQPAAEPNRIWKTLAKQIRAAAFRPEREYLGAFIALWIVIMAVAALPVAGALWLQDAATSAAEATAQEELGALPQPAAGAEATEKKPSLCSLFVCPVAPKAKPKPKAEAALAEEFRDARLRFLVGLVLFWGFGLAALWSQGRMAGRYWEIALEDRIGGPAYRLSGPPSGLIALLFPTLIGGAFWLSWDGMALNALYQAPWNEIALIFFAASVLGGIPAAIWRAQRDKSDSVRWRSDLRFGVRWLPVPTLLIGVMLGYVLVAQLNPDDLKTLSITHRAGAPDTALWALILAASVALLFAITVLTAFGTYSYGWDVPSHDRAQRVLRGVMDTRHRAEVAAPQLWALMKAGVVHGIHVAEANDDPEAAARLFPPMPMMSRTPAKTCDAAVRLLSRPLAVMIVAALIVLALGQGVLDISAIKTPDPDKAPSASFLWLALAMTVSFVLIVVVPLVRLGPFIVDAKDGTPEAPNVQLFGAAAQVDMATVADMPDLKEPEENPLALHHLIGETEDLPERVLRRHLGADQAKFTAILASTSTGAIFQSLLGKGLKGQLASVLTLIAPAAVSVLIDFLK